MTAPGSRAPADGRRGPGPLQWALAALALVPMLLSLALLGRDAVRAWALAARSRALRTELSATRELGALLAERRAREAERAARIDVAGRLWRRRSGPRVPWDDLIAVVPAEHLAGPAWMGVSPTAIELPVTDASAEPLRALAARLVEEGAVGAADVRRVARRGLVLRLTAAEPRPPERRP